MLRHDKTWVKQYICTPLTHKFYLILLLLQWLIVLHYVNISSLICMALHPQLNTSPFLYLENRQGLMKAGAVLPHCITEEVMMCKIVSSTARIEIMHLH